MKVFVVEVREVETNVYCRDDDCENAEEDSEAHVYEETVLDAGVVAVKERALFVHEVEWETRMEG